MRLLKAMIGFVLLVAWPLALFYCLTGGAVLHSQCVAMSVPADRIGTAITGIYVLTSIPFMLSGIYFEWIKEWWPWRKKAHI